MEQQLAPGTVLVTGGASGLGAAVATAVRDAGGTPVVFDVNEAPGFDTEIVDLSDARAAEAAVDHAGRRHGGLDAVVTAAGIDRPAPLRALPGAEWDKIIGVNLIGTAAGVRAALPYLQESPNARVITVASTLGLSVASDATAYCASKWGIVGFTRSLAAELKGQVGVTLLVPGGMDTAFFDGRDEQYKPPPDAKLADPADIARAVLFALTQPPGLELRELVVTASEEGSWP
ncbi:MAG TPA: SDR family oxidoreductase [Trebonia sp.]|nr:SDR family oxidoreductase [Trebonia sp.]